MSNVIQLSNTQRGFTRMDNDLYEALIGADLSARELRVAMAVHRQSVGYNKPEVRVTASYIAEMSGISRENVSRAMSELLRQRVLYRHGGARSPVGISEPSDWNIDPKSKVSNTAQSVKTVTSKVSILTHNKDRKDNTTSNEVVITPPEQIAEQEAPKPKKPRKQAFGISEMLADNPHGLTENTLTDYLSLRKAKRAPITANVWAALNAELHKCVAAGITAPAAMAEALLNGWQGFKVDWIVNRLGAANGSKTGISRHSGFDDRDYSAGLIEREDGTHGF